MPGIPQLSFRDNSKLKFNYVDDKVGEALIEPLYDKCFKLNLDIWEYQVCFGQKVDQYNTQNKSESYHVGTFTGFNKEKEE